MASFLACNGSIKGVSFQDYVGSRSSPHQCFIFVRPQIGKFSLRKFILKATISEKKQGFSNEECESAVVSGHVPDAPPPPPRPAGPPGTPSARPLSLARRPRRLRGSAALRDAVQETHLSASNLVYPLFIHEGEEDTPIGAMPGCYRLGWRHGLVEEVAKALSVGVNQVILFPKVPDTLKSPTGDEAYNENGLVPCAIRLLKDKYPDLVIYTDVALDPYSSDGHDGIVREDGVIMNDETVHQLCKQAVAQVCKCILWSIPGSSGFKSTFWGQEDLSNEPCEL